MLNIFFFQLYDKDVYLVIHIQNNNIETKIKTKIFLMQEKKFVDGLCKYSDINKFALKINENESCELHLSKDTSRGVLEMARRQSNKRRQHDRA